MTEDDVAVAVKDWVLAELPSLTIGRSWLTAQKTTLPDVVVDVAEKGIVLQDNRFPRLTELQQVALRVFEVEFSIMTAHEADGSADQSETEELRGYGATLEASLLNDGTLGDKVFMASPIATFNYRLPFVQYEDGTRGRQMAVALAVAEPVQPGSTT